jgi:hypothetical protein
MVEREWFDKDYYKVLGLSSSATEKEITRAYRKLAKSSHPDTNPGSEEKFVVSDRPRPGSADRAVRVVRGRAVSTSKRATSATSATSSEDCSVGDGVSEHSAALISKRRYTWVFATPSWV